MPPLETLIFRGYILPLNTKLTLPTTNQELFLPSSDKKLADLVIHINSGAITCILDIHHLPDEIKNLEGWRNTIAPRIEAITDVIGFVDGGWYAVELEDVLVSSSKHLYPFHNSLSLLKETNPSDTFHYRCVKAMALTRGEYGPYFQRALAELGKSIRHQFDSPVHAYRAIEFISQIYALKNNLITHKNKSRVWEMMTEDLNLEEEFIKKTIKIHSDPIRHGEIRNFTEEERATLFESAWIVIRKYVDKHASKALQELGSPLSTNSREVN